MSEHKPTIVVFANQKGGAGKTTTLILTASDLFYGHNKNVFVIDADYPQHSVKGLRDIEIDYLKNDEQFIRQFMKYGKKPLYNVLPTPMQNVFDRVNPSEASGYEIASFPDFNTEFILIDTPGSLAVDGIADVLLNVDVIVIPLEPEQMSLSSAVQFVGALNKLIDGTGANTKIVAVWNKIRIQSHASIMESQAEFFRSRGVHVLDNYIPESVTLKRSETRSTVLPININSLSLTGLMAELTGVLKQARNVQETA